MGQLFRWYLKTVNNVSLKKKTIKYQTDDIIKTKMLSAKREMYKTKFGSWKSYLNILRENKRKLFRKNIWGRGR